MNTSIKTINCVLFSVPLPEVMSDAKHGGHTHFELVTTTITMADGTQGTGYTYTGGKGGNAIKAMIDHDIAPALIAKDGSEIDVIYDFMEWHMHYVGRGGIDLQFPIPKLLKNIECYLAAGFNAVKIKIGRENLGEDTERIKAVREFIGADITFMVDANYSKSLFKNNAN